MHEDNPSVPVNNTRLHDILYTYTESPTEGQALDKWVEDLETKFSQDLLTVILAENLVAGLNGHGWPWKRD